MDKLISANSLYKKFSINSKGERIPEYDVDNFPVTLTLREIKKIIMDEPAAFDKEKVIEDLKEEGCIVDNEAGYRAVEIVEKGGVE